MCSAETSQSARWQPSAASCRASSRPMPVPAPVITASLPRKSFIVLLPEARMMPQPGYVARVGLISRLVERLARLPPATHRLDRIERDLVAPMDDGARLLADVYHPSGAAKAPTV